MRVALTLWRPHRKGQVRTCKECDRLSGTHYLETASYVTSQDTEGPRPRECNSHTRDHMGRNKLGHGNNATGKRALTNWRPHRKGEVRRRKECVRESTTHALETASEETSQDKERLRQRVCHSRTGDRIIRDKSGHRNSKTERVALTIWRPQGEG